MLYYEFYNALFHGETHIYTFIAPDVGMVGQEISSGLVVWKKKLTNYTHK